jgi:hypothetical protein
LKRRALVAAKDPPLHNAAEQARIPFPAVLRKEETLAPCSFRLTFERDFQAGAPRRTFCGSARSALRLPTSLAKAMDACLAKRHAIG